MSVTDVPVDGELPTTKASATLRENAPGNAMHEPNQTALLTLNATQGIEVTVNPTPKLTSAPALPDLSEDDRDLLVRLGGKKGAEALFSANLFDAHAERIINHERVQRGPSKKLGGLRPPSLNSHGEPSERRQLVLRSLDRLRAHASEGWPCARKRSLVQHQEYFVAEDGTMRVFAVRIHQPVFCDEPCYDPTCLRCAGEIQLVEVKAS